MIERERLEALLSEMGTVEIPMLAVAALVAGADFEVSDHPVGAARIRSLFGRRERTARRAGQPSVGFAESVHELGAYEGSHFVTGYIDDRPRGGYFFQLFLTPDQSSIVTCFGIRPSKKGRTEGQEGVAE